MALTTKSKIISSSGGKALLIILLAIGFGAFVWLTEHNKPPQPQKFKYMVHCSESVRVEYIATKQLPVTEVCK